MGLLDEAIHEHLELRRRRGADPGLVAREEHDAFGPAGETAYCEDHELDAEPTSDGLLEADGVFETGVLEADDLRETGTGSMLEADGVLETGVLEADDLRETGTGSMLEADGVLETGVLKTGDAHKADESTETEADLEPVDAESHGGKSSHIGQETAELDMSSVLGAPDEPDLDLGTAVVAAGGSVDPGRDASAQDPPDCAFEDDDAPVHAPDQERLWLDKSLPRDLDLGS